MNRTVHRFFIPDGIWYDFRKGKKFPGNKKYVSFFKEEDYPVFAHAGSIIPLSNRSDYNNVGLQLIWRFKFSLVFLIRILYMKMMELRLCIRMLLLKDFY